MLGKRKRIRQATRKKPGINPRQLASCHGKVRWGKKDREKALANRPTNIKFYKCDFCAYYHIGRRKGGKP